MSWVKKETGGRALVNCCQWRVQVADGRSRSICSPSLELLLDEEAHLGVIDGLAELTVVLLAEDVVQLGLIGHDPVSARQRARSDPKRALGRKLLDVATNEQAWDEALQQKKNVVELLRRQSGLRWWLARHWC